MNSRFKGPIVYYVPGEGGLEGGGVQFSKRLDSGGSILQMHKMRGRSKY